MDRVSMSRLSLVVGHESLAISRLSLVISHQS